MWQRLQDIGGYNYMNNLNQIDSVFQNKKAFIPFITAGDPCLEVTKQLVFAMEEAGADLIELGIPFSDPVAEGVVIQKADERALKAGTTTDKIFDMVKEIRKQSNIPLTFMTYVNPIFVFGVEKFARLCRECQVQAVIVPDIPFEEKEELAPYFEKEGIHFISLIAPTSNDRIQMIAKEANGFLYCVSSLGVTGVRTEIHTNIKEMIRLVKEVNEIPCAIGFGISTPEQAKEMCSISDGIIVGSAIVKIIEKFGENCIHPVKEYISKMKEAIQIP